MEEKQPEIIVSIDLGTTYTGVAWKTKHTPIQIINDWPGSGDRGERKVPTVLVYNSNGSLSSWGFLTDEEDENEDHNNEDTEKESRDGPTNGVKDVKCRVELFKILLDPSTLAAAHQQGLSQGSWTAADVQRFATDYLRQIYLHTKKVIELQTGARGNHGWANTSIEFLFSVPTTWTKMQVINIFKGVIRNAGFGVEGRNHSARIDLTEAEAAAVATLKTSAVRFGMGSVFLAVDAGGGTTDLALMRVTSNDTVNPQMSQIAAVKGVGIGSTVLDRAFVKLVSNRLASFPDANKELPEDCATRLVRSHRYKMVKHKFGEAVYMQPIFKIQVEGVSHQFTHKGLGIENGRMLFSLDEIKLLFDTQIDGVMKCVKEQLDWLATNMPDLEVDFIILSGGLGSSAYVRQSIQQHLVTAPHKSAVNAMVIPCQDPQLVVVRGLILDYQQKMETGNLSILATRVARASYGLIVKELYSANRHFNADTIQDRFDPNKRWAINQIEWLIKKGDQIDLNRPLVKSFERFVADGDTTRAWDAELVISHNEVTFLPRDLKQAGVTRLCCIRSNLAGVQQHQLILKEKRGTCFTKGHKYFLCRFDIRVIIAPADLHFELWFAGRKFSGNHEPIGIQWDTKGLEAGE